MTDTETGHHRGEGRGKRGNSTRCTAVLTILTCVTLCQAQIRNPGFESAWSKYSLPYNACYPHSWSRSTPRPGFALGTTEDWSSEGARAARIYGCWGQVVTAGDYMSFHQDVDLTGIGGIVFDARLAAFPWGQFKDFEAALLVEGQVLWSGTAHGEYRAVKVDMSRFSGRCRVELRCTALVSTILDTSCWVLWDNLEAIEGASFIEATIDLDPDTLSLSSHGRYVTCYIELPPGYSVDTIEGASVTLGEGATAIPACRFAACADVSEGTEANATDRDGDGFCEYMVKFDRAAVQELAALASEDGNATLTVTGQFGDGLVFKGTDTIRVLDRPGKRNKKGK